MSRVSSDLSTLPAVREIINSWPILQEAISLEIVNYSALSRLLKPLLEKNLAKKVNEEAVLMALLRYSKEFKKSQTLTSDLRKVIASSHLTMTDNVNDVILKRASTVLDKLSILSKNTNWDLGEIFYYVQGSGEITVILDNKNLAKLNEHISDHFFIEIKKDLVLIRLRFDLKEFLEVPGGIHFFTSLLHRHGVNVVELQTSYVELIFLVEESDATKVFSLFKEEINKAKEN